MATSYHLLYSQFVTAFSTPKFQVLNKTEVDIKSWIFPWLTSFKSTFLTIFSFNFNAIQYFPTITALKMNSD